MAKIKQKRYGDVHDQNMVDGYILRGCNSSSFIFTSFGLAQLQEQILCCKNTA